MADQGFKTEIGIGATEKLSLRVSVAVLVRVLFEHPDSGESMLALERRTTVVENKNGRSVHVKSHPFGGAIHIRDLKLLQKGIGDFHFDSEQSRSEQDFRLFIRSSAWEAVREFCLKQFAGADGLVLESDPRRELTEEFTEAMGTSLKPDQYTYNFVGMILEDNPVLTENANARGYLTARIYRIFEAHISDASLATALVRDSETYSDEQLRRSGGARANTVLTLSLRGLTSFYASLSPELREQPVLFQNHELDDTVAALLGVDVPKYQRVLF